MISNDHGLSKDNFKFFSLNYHIYDVTKCHNYDINVVTVTLGWESEILGSGKKSLIIEPRDNNRISS